MTRCHISLAVAASNHLPLPRSEFELDQTQCVVLTKIRVRFSAGCGRASLAQFGQSKQLESDGVDNSIFNQPDANSRDIDAGDGDNTLDFGVFTDVDAAAIVSLDVIRGT